MPKEIPIKLFLDTVPIPSADNVSESVTKMFLRRTSENTYKVTWAVHLSKIHVTLLFISTLSWDSVTKSDLTITCE